MVLKYPDPATSQGKTTSDTDVVEARFVDLVPDARVIYSADFMSNDHAFGDTMIMTWEVTPVESGTRVQITADNVPDAVPEADHAAGLASSLAKLAAYLAK